LIAPHPQGGGVSIALSTGTVPFQGFNVTTILVKIYKVMLEKEIHDQIPNPK